MAQSHVKAAERYARDVISGKVIACKWVKAACQRQFDDLERSKRDKSWPFVFSAETAEKWCKFVELMPHVKGKQWAGQHIKLEPWQQFAIACVYGWLHRKTGLRRFRSAYLEVGRKNAKTSLMGALSLGHLTIDEEMGAECYSGATTRDQAKIVFNISKQMAQAEPGFRAEFGVQVFENSLAIDATGSKMVALSAEGSTLDGLNTSFCVLDELHAHKTRAVHDVIDSSLGSRSQPLIWKITTAGSDRSGVCYDVRLYLTKILNTTLKAHGGMGYKVEGNCAEDDSTWGIIYTLDAGEEKDPFNEANWIKANPNFGISVDADDMRRMARMARTQSAALGEFLTKRCNVWVGADTGWLNMLEWDACADTSLSEDDFRGERCWIGLDAGFKRDLFAKVRVFVREISTAKPDGTVVDVAHYYVFARCYTHQTLIEAEGSEQLQAWTRDGWIRVSEGNVTDIADVREELIGAVNAEVPGDLQRFDIAEVAYDPAQIQPFASEMIEQGLPMVEVRPLVLHFSPAMKEIEELVTARRLHHNGDPVLGWMMANVVCHRDGKDNIYPRKERAENKIDAAVALIMALGRAMLSRPDGPSYYEALAAEQATERARIAVEAMAHAEIPEPVPQPEEALSEVLATPSHLSYWEQVAAERLLTS